MSTTTPHTDVADLALSMLRAGQSTAQVRTLLRTAHGLGAIDATRLIKRAQLELETPPEAVAVAETLLRAGRSSVDQVRAAVRERFDLSCMVARRVVDAAVAGLVEDFELGEVDAFLSSAMDQVSDCSLSAAERGKVEKQLATVFAVYDQLTDPDATARETISAAKRLDKLLTLGWRARLPRGAFD